MSKTYLQLFKKYIPSDSTILELLSTTSIVSTKVDKSSKKIEVEVSFSRKVSRDDIRTIEKESAVAHEASSVHIRPIYNSTLFDDDAINDAIYETRYSEKISQGFLDNYTFKIIDKTIYIYTCFDDDAISFLTYSNTDKEISNLLKKMYDVDYNVVFKVDANNSFDVTGYMDSLNSEIDSLNAQIEQERIDSRYELDNSKDSSENENSKTVEYFPSTTIFNSTNEVIKNDKTISVGYASFDISETEVVFGDDFEVDVTPISLLNQPTKNVCIIGTVVNFEEKETKNKDKIILTVGLTDEEGSINVKIIGTADEIDKAKSIIKASKYKSTRGTVKLEMYSACLAVYGSVKMDKFDKELSLNADSIKTVKKIERMDTSEEKRVELHVHTNMSQKDATILPSDLVKTAARWGHKAVAITDHGNVQGFPEAMLTAEKLDIKVIYGMEAYFVDDSQRAVYGDKDQDIDGDFVVFDIETTGFSPLFCEIIEIGAVKIKNGKIIDRFDKFIKPEKSIPQNITELTGISNDMVESADPCEMVLKEFLDYVGDSILIAHNANFDISFINTYSKKYNYQFNNTYIDTVALSRHLNPNLKKHTLDSVIKYYSDTIKQSLKNNTALYNKDEIDRNRDLQFVIDRYENMNHHRGDDDSETLAAIFFMMRDAMKNDGMFRVSDINRIMGDKSDPKKQRPYHMIILVKNLVGLKNLYKLISMSYLDYYYRYPRIPKTKLEEHRDGLIIGSACEAGELFSAIKRGVDDSVLEEIASFYDYLEIQPLSNNRFMINDGTVSDEEGLKSFNRKIVELGDKLNKPVVATTDAHFLEKHHEIYRKILLQSMKFKDADKDSELYFRTTDEMLQEFSYLGEDIAHKVVIENPNAIADMVEKIRPIPEGKYTPSMDGAEEELQNLCWTKARSQYGDDLPQIVYDRLKRELDSIIEHGFAVLYMIAQKLVFYSEEQGFHVGSRGSVGSSFVANMAGISEVNSLPPHYRCKKCKYSEFFTDGSVASGFDLPPKDCPKCGEKDMLRDGHDIPFETFLGFKGDKDPDIDLNFSGDVQGRVHKYTEELFGSQNVFRAGTISAVAEKTAFGYIKKYLDEHERGLNKAEIQRLIFGIAGVKNTTGQHPGGIIVVPKEYEVYDFTPVQHPADDSTSNIVTTHFAFTYLHETILKLDELGHDMPTKYKWLEKYSGMNVNDVPMSDPKVYDLFLSTKSLGVTEDEICSKLGTFGLPEFGTNFVQQVIVETKPTKFSDLLQISGLTHGTDVWTNNGDELIRDGTCTISELIGTRDSIMLYLMYHGVDKSMSFKIMEDVRKGKGLKPEYEAAMREQEIPEWYISSCKKIKYMFPKAHAAAYVISAIRLAWFKVYMPKVFYAAFFTAAPNGFDSSIVAKGQEHVRNYLIDIQQRKRQKATEKKEEDMIPFLQLANEAMCRGVKFLPVSITHSDSYAFIPEEDGVRMPFNTLPGIGTNAAQTLVDAIKQGEVFSVEDLKSRGITSKTIEILNENGVLKGLSETNQIDMFGSDFKSVKKKETKTTEKQTPVVINDQATTIGSDDQISLF